MSSIMFMLLMIFFVGLLLTLLYIKSLRNTIKNQKLLLKDMDKLSMQNETSKIIISLYEKTINLYKNEELELLGKEIRTSQYRLVKMKETYKGKRALLGDYDLDSIKNSRRILISLGLDVDLAYSKKEMIERLKKDITYDVIITNNIYPDGHGIDIKFKAKELGYNGSIIVASIDGNKKSTKFIHEDHFDEYFQKILKQEEVEKKLRRFLT